MILLVDLCYEKDSLSQYEFVHPIASHLEDSGVVCSVAHFTEVTRNSLDNSDKIILCGTALKDNYYAEHLELFSWIRDCDKPLLGICAGMQVIGAVFGGRIICQAAIGLDRIEIIRESPLLGEPREIQGYHLHGFGVTLPKDFRLLAGGQESVEAFGHRALFIFGIIFHPEVRNRWILERFANL
jgi:GMP synthase-like glutamine amidotransferase